MLLLIGDHGVLVLNLVVDDVNIERVIEHLEVDQEVCIVEEVIDKVCQVHIVLEVDQVVQDLVVIIVLEQVGLHVIHKAVLVI